MLERKEFMPVNFLKKEPYTGSHKGMRYRMWKGEMEGNPVLMTAAWPEPYGFEATPEEKKTAGQFEFSSQGIDEAVEWLNRQYEENYSRQTAKEP